MYIRALEKELTSFTKTDPVPLESIYVGGGTPSLLRPECIEKILRKSQAVFPLGEDCEITIEANPGTVTRQKAEAYREAGINRVSLGMQSANESELIFLGRVHTAKQTEETIVYLRDAGFKNLNLDLMYGLPSQSLESWEASLDAALQFAPEHLSLYALTVERGTALSKGIQARKIIPLDDDLAADMYELAETKLAAAGYRHYEISNWAKENQPFTSVAIPKFASRHNIRYWKTQPYFGIGAGAHGYASGRRYSNIRSIEKYIQRLNFRETWKAPFSPAVTSRHRVSREEERKEFLWLGLRLVEAGVTRKEFAERFQAELMESFSEPIRVSESKGLLERVEDGERLRLTKKGRLLGNQVFSLFV